MNVRSGAEEGLPLEVSTAPGSSLIYYTAAGNRSRYPWLRGPGLPLCRRSIPTSSRIPLYARGC